MEELNLEQAPEVIIKEEFRLERVRLQTVVAATDPGCKNERIRSGSLGLLTLLQRSPKWWSVDKISLIPRKM
ncbi:hypothetical protein TNCV_1940641 [Trichonephila clavipes]|nr:hypothetical protein TNCV_1940641 [Trichonephila clavipes]